MKKSVSNEAKISREKSDLEAALALSPTDNPIAWAALLRLVGPMIARLAVRYALKKAARSLSEDKVNAIGVEVASFIGQIISKRTL